MISMSLIKETKVMRTLVDLGDVQLQALDELSRKEKRSRAALIRQAIDEYLAKQRDKQEGDAFGLWGKRKVDGLAYQEKVRSEW
jgi:predicted transcriptional regulator